MSELTVLVHCSGQNLLDILDSITSNENNNFEISENATIGLFNEWNGAGSILAIELEKPLIIPTNMIRDIQIESRIKNRYNYTVDNVYGLIGKAWRGTIEPTDEVPILIEEDLRKTIKIVKDLLLKNG